MQDRGGNGTRIGRYEILRRLAVGGMAEVLLARVRGPAGFEKRVVLKCVLPQFFGDAEFLTMFLDEARLVASLNHPNIAEVHDVGSDGETTYIAMEYVEGADVRTVLKTLRARNEKMPLEHVLAIAGSVCAGLHAAHEKRSDEGTPLGIVHRDVSPSNVMVSFEGGVKLVDFGIAKWEARNVRTRSGLLKGKSAYMSPEQCMGLELDRRSDLFAVGILLHEMVTGQPLFKAENDYAAMCKVVRDEVPPPSAMRTIPPALETAILRALARRPEDRFQSADELAIALEQIAHRERISTSPTNLARWMQTLMATAEANPTPSPRAVIAPTPLPGMPPPLGAPAGASAPRPSMLAVTVEALPGRGTPPDGSPRANASALPTMIEQGVPGIGLPARRTTTELGISPLHASQSPTPLNGGLAMMSALDVPPVLAPPAYVPPTFVPAPVNPASALPTMAERIMQERMPTIVEAPLVAVTETPTDLRLKRLNLATGTGNSKLSALDVRPPRRVGRVIGRLMLTGALATSLALAWLHYGDDARRLWRAQAGASEAEDVKAAAAEPTMPAALQPSDVAPPETPPTPATADKADDVADKTVKTADLAPTPEKVVKKAKARRDREERRDRKKKRVKAVKGPGAGLSLDDAPEPDDDGGPGGSIDL